MVAIKTADPKNSEAANKSPLNSDKRLFPLKIYHACGSSHRTAAHLPTSLLADIYLLHGRVPS